MIIVVGGGPAGLAAAEAASRNGTLRLEKVVSTGATRLR
jgi:flavin-dependent dehydrogenase